jgi:hypothetical protein
MLGDAPQKRRGRGNVAVASKAAVVDMVRRMSAVD